MSLLVGGANAFMLGSYIEQRYGANFITLGASPLWDGVLSRGRSKASHRGVYRLGQQI